ncbi:MAG: threonine ammonia-lyase [Nanoarchaeota archaeon]|nr:threonine ammonia-lyase [Nanoarchaeota archaeon]
MAIDFEAARKRLKGTAKITPLINLKVFNTLSGNNVFLKLENLQFTGAFKIRGAYNKISLLTKEEKKKGVIAASTGNHAQAVAYSARELRVKATIVMPKGTAHPKIEATKNYKAKVILHGKLYDEAYQKAKEIQEKEDLVFIHPYDDEDIISGQGTIGLEIMEQLPETDYIFVPIGGGGLISGIAIASKQISPKIKIIGVQPEQANSIKTKKGRFVMEEPKSIHTIADGTSVKHPGEITLNLINKYVDEIVTVSEQEIKHAMVTLLERGKFLAEPSGVLSLAAMINKKVDIKNKNVVGVISGGNMDLHLLIKLIKLYLKK